VTEELSLHDSVEDLSDSQSHCSMLSSDHDKATLSHHKERRKEERTKEKPPPTKRRKYKHHK